jgi:hypothetical protein
MAEGGLGEVRAADGPVRGAARGERLLVERPAQLVQRGGHPVGAAQAVGAVVGQGGEQLRVAMVDAVAEDVEILVRRVDRRDLDRGHDADPDLARGGQRLLDSVDRVVVGEREHLDPGRRRPTHDLRRRERPVGVRRVRLQVEPRHGLSRSRRGAARRARARPGR